MTDAIRKYLSLYAEKESQAIEAAELNVDYAVVVPALDEAETLPPLLDSLAIAARTGGHRVLVILVVNATVRASPELRIQNEVLLKQLGMGNKSSHVTGWDGLTVLVLDRTRPGRELPEKQGVGLARKIGCDIALHLYSAGKIAHPILSTTDGDARVSERYFDFTPKGKAFGLGTAPVAFLHPYRHEIEKSPALRLYDTYLRYYESGLLFAGSPYAFPTIGSTLSFTYQGYAEVRGFPRREAGEDFYLLDKLAKIGLIQHTGGEIFLVSRRSLRVPFGTGASVFAIEQNAESGKAYCVYDPRTFVLLRSLIHFFRECAQDRNEERGWNKLRNEYSSRGASGAIPILERMEVRPAIRQAMATRPHSPGLERHLHTWFDGFRTLKFVHGIRDEVFGLTRLEEAVEGLKEITRLERPSGEPGCGR